MKFLKSNDAANGKSAAAKKEGTLSIITHDMNILGNIVSEGTIDFDGTIDGNIRCKTLTLRANATVKGEITADSLFVYGKINGIVRVGSIHLHTGCYVEGIILHQMLTMEDGAFLDGKCKRTDKIKGYEEQDEIKLSDDPAPLSSNPMLENIRLIRSKKPATT